MKHGCERCGSQLYKASIFRPYGAGNKKGKGIQIWICRKCNFRTTFEEKDSGEKKMKLPSPKEQSRIAMFATHGVTDTAQTCCPNAIKYDRQTIARRLQNLIHNNHDESSNGHLQRHIATLIKELEGDKK